MKRLTLLLAFLVLAACPGGDGDVATVRLGPDGHRVLEYSDPPVEQRDHRVELVEDLVVGPRGEDPAYLFYWPQGVAVDDRGRMYVADTRNARVQVFDANGEYVRTLGREGQGPAEFVGPVDVAIADDLLVVNDVGALRLSVWDLGGAHVGVLRAPGRLQPKIFGMDSGVIVMGVNARDEGRRRVIDVTGLAPDGSEQRLARIPLAPDLLLEAGGDARIVVPRFLDATSYTAALDGEVYVTSGKAYTITALDAAGDTRWELRADRRQPVFDQEYRDRVLAPFRRETPNLGNLTGNWPDLLPVIGDLALDGHGHLYVFSYTFRDMKPAAQRIEVYDSDGRRLMAGSMSGDSWQAALGDFVYALRTDELSGEEKLVRYRLVEAF